MIWAAADLISERIYGTKRRWFLNRTSYSRDYTLPILEKKRNKFLMTLQVPYNENGDPSTRPATQINKITQLLTQKTVYTSRLQQERSHTCDQISDIWQYLLAFYLFSNPTCSNDCGDPCYSCTSDPRLSPVTKWIQGSFSTKWVKACTWMLEV